MRNLCHDSDCLGAERAKRQGQLCVVGIKPIERQAPMTGIVLGVNVKERYGHQHTLSLTGCAFPLPFSTRGHIQSAAWRFERLLVVLLRAKKKRTLHRVTIYL